MPNGTSCPAIRTELEIEADALRIDELLDRCQGDREFAGRVLEKFRTRLPRDVDELQKAAEAGDGDLVRRLAHQMKGCAGNVGAAVLQQRAAVLETCVLEQTDVAEDVSALASDAEACLAAIGALLEEFEQA